MAESLERAWQGWQQFTEHGKLAALLIAVLLYLVIGNRQKGPRGRLVCYSAVAAVLCICPLTAVFLMKYQTAFYDYPWIWSVVPVTTVIALGGTLFLMQQRRQGKSWRDFFYHLLITGLCAGTLILCGAGSGAESSGAWGGEGQSPDMRSRTASVLTEVRAHFTGDEDICLWAPRQILEYARVQEGSVTLLYGRNMWDVALNAYSYDVYPQEVKELYLWMEQLEEYGCETSQAEGEAMVAAAAGNGVNCILLPKAMQGWRPVSAENYQVTELEQYYLLICTK